VFSRPDFQCQPPLFRQFFRKPRKKKFGQKQSLGPPRRSPFSLCRVD
jgi:hypothetical protein